MPILNDKYESLTLNDEYLSDPLLMALAWKKAHDYIRTTNWYADNFELDISSIDLPNRCQEWTEQIQSGVVFEQLELVPAPKTHLWEFAPPDYKDNPLEISPYRLIWQPTSGPEGNIKPLSLRPLAHIGIREQTVMTLVMMCLANEVESRQGDPDTKYEAVHEKRIVSYGNRLYCRYSGGRAEHSYGATTTYSKFFADYRRFLERPYYFAKKELEEKSEEENVYLIDLDLSQFFDRVDRQLLTNKIRTIAMDTSQLEPGSLKSLNNILEAFVSWEWSEDAKSKFRSVCSSGPDSEVPSGLPQGLVASGFLANIYMDSFDDHMSSLIGEVLDDALGVKLADYCRYVDDMRLIVTGPGRERLRELLIDDDNSGSYLDIIKGIILNALKPYLDDLNLIVNDKKTKIEVFRGKSAGISATLKDIQSSVSGPVSYEDSEIHLGQLESLLVISDTPIVDQSNGTGSLNLLANIEKDMFDVREDTLKRFAANKITKLLNSIRHFTSRETDERGCPLPGKWDYLQERLARRFIACWSRDPALVLLLKKGLELFPSPKLLEPVLDQLQYLNDLAILNWSGLPAQQSERQAAIGRYCMAEVFRHAATVIHRKDPQAIPAHSNIDGFFELLQSRAIEFIKPTPLLTRSGKKVAFGTKPASPRFDLLATQARFLLLVRLDTTLESSSGCWRHDFIFKLATGFRDITLPQKKSARDIAAAVLIASQLISEPKPLYRAASSLLDRRRDAAVVMELIATQDTSLFRSIVLHARPLKYAWLDDDRIRKLTEKLYIGVRPSAKALKKVTSSVALFKLTSRPDNPFANEIMALKLMQALLDKKELFPAGKSAAVIDLSKTKVSFDHFGFPTPFEAFDGTLTLEMLHFQSALSLSSSHLQSTDIDTFVLQRVALCIRAALTGSEDPTGFGQFLTPTTGYRGLKSTRFKRQVGMLTTPESLAGEGAQFSGWLTTLLSKLLRWPGIRVNDQGYSWPVELNVENVQKLLDERLGKFKQLYCRQSHMPGLPELVSPNWSLDKKDLIVAMVQTKMPQVADFGEHGIFLDAPEYRCLHRRHLARVASLVTKHIEAQHIKKPTNGEREQDIDLIVLPELAVHPDDIDVLIQLSRKTHAIVVAGLGFMTQAGVRGPNNCAIWIVPRKHNGNRNEINRLQGKQHMTASEKAIKIEPWRPYQLMMELVHPAFRDAPGFMLTASICFDSTDIALSADLRDRSHALLIPALNRDVNTFDSMIEALHYHMYQHVVLVNSGEFGGSHAMAPYDNRNKRLIAHSSGNDQVTINTFKMNMFDFRRDGVGASMQSGMKLKTAPAGVDTQ